MPSSRLMRDKHSNCRLADEDREWLAALPELPSAFNTYSRPAFVPVDWHQTGNQGQLGSCRGYSGTSGLERLQMWKVQDVSQVVQMSEIFFYLATQRIDGLLGRDSGSTISGGLKLALEFGCCPKSNTGYPRSYPRKSDRNQILSAQNYDDGAPYKAKSVWKVPDDPDEAMNFIGGGGVIDYGIAWWSGLIPRDRIIRSYKPPRGRLGGHAMVALGYTQDGKITAVNSHNDGPYWWEPSAWRQMIRYQRTAAVGYAGDDEPEPIPFDWGDYA